MNYHLSQQREQFIHRLVQSGRYASEDEVIDQAVRLLQEQEEAEAARVLNGIRQGLDDMKSGRGRPADEVFADLRREFNLPPDA